MINIVLRLILIGVVLFTIPGTAPVSAQPIPPARSMPLLSGAPPTAFDDAYPLAGNTLYEDGTLNISAAEGVLGNDTDPEFPLDTLTAELVSDVSHGTLALQLDGSFTYSPDPDYFGTDSFQYHADDGTGESAAATVTITITGVNDPIDTTDDAYDTDEDVNLIVAAPGVLVNDIQVDTGETLTLTVTGNPAQGNVTLNDDGSFTYESDPDVNGTDTFTYVVNDGTVDSDTGIVTITINAVNDAPTANDDPSYTVDEDSSLTVAAPGVLANDEDIESSSLTVDSYTQPTHGTVTVGGNGSFTYTPTGDYSGSDSFTYIATDGELFSTSATVSIGVNALNDAPVAEDNAYSVDEDTLLTVTVPGVLGNDTDADPGDDLNAVLVQDAQHGTLTLNSIGSFDYDPNANFHGSDSFIYRANDGEVNSNTATVTLTIDPVNDAPQAEADSFLTDEDATLTVTTPNLLTNDSDVDGDSLTVVLDRDVEHGSLTLNNDGTFDYVPTANFFGEDSFAYHASDGLLPSLQVEVTLTIGSVNDAPVAEADSYQTDEDTPLVVAAAGVLVNDNDEENSTLTVAGVVTQPVDGTVVLANDGSFTYTPDDDFNGTDSFTYRASDGEDDSNLATVTIDVEAVNDAPQAAADQYLTDEDTLLEVSAPGFLANDSDIDGNPITAVQDSSTANGTLTFHADGSFTYEPDDNFAGSDSFTYHATDGVLISDTVTVSLTVTAVNDAPEALPESYSTDEDTPLVVNAELGVLANDTDLDNASLQAVLDQGPVNGSLILNDNGSFTYTPGLNYTGSDNFRYHASDGLLSSPSVLVTLTIQPVNDAPVAVADSYQTNEDTPLDQPAPGILMNDTDAENSALTAFLVDGPDNGTLTLFSSTGQFVYTPDENYHGPDSFTYYVNDGDDPSGTVTVNLNVISVNDAPVAGPDSYSTPEDTQLTVAINGLLANDNDVDGDTLQAALVTGPTRGTVTLNQNGTFLYTPGGNLNGPDSFTYRALDTAAMPSEVTTVTIQVVAVNDAPAASANTLSTDEDIPLGITLTGSDVDNDPLTYIIFTNPQHGTISGTPPAVTYTPATNYHGADSFTFRVSDSQLTASATITLTVNPVNDAPVGVPETLTVAEDSILTIAAPGILSNDTDVENNSLTAVPVSGPTSGALTLNTNGSLIYTPNPNYNGSDTFVYRASDGGATSPNTTVTVNVTPVNDAPRASGETYSIAEDTPLTTAAPGVKYNDSDVDGDALSLVLVSGPVNGTLAINTSTGAFNYIPALNHNGSDSFTYYITDGSLRTSNVTTLINIAAVNDAPEALNDLYTIGKDGVLIIDPPGLLGNDNDVEGSALEISSNSDPTVGTLEVNADGSFIYRTQPNTLGIVTFTYTISDGDAESAETTVSIEVTPPASIGVSWTSPVITGKVYRVAKEYVPLDIKLAIPTNFPCNLDAPPAYCEEGSGFTITLTDPVVRYYRWNSLRNMFEEIVVVESPPYLYMLYTDVLNANDFNEIMATATVLVTATHEDDPPILDTYTTPRQHIWLRRFPWETIFRSFMPAVNK